MKFLAPLALASTLCAPAFAGGMVEPVTEPMIAPVMMAPVNADWTGFYAGGQLGYGEVSSNNVAVNGNGAAGGVHMGYRYDFGQFVAGGELAYNGTNGKKGPANKLNSVTQLKLMGGYDLGSTLVYATAGAAYGKATIAGVDRSDTGYLLGLGMDYAINDKWTVGAEAVHHRVDNFDGTATNVRANSLQMRVGYRF